MKKLYYYLLVLALIPGLHSLQGQDLNDVNTVLLTFTPAAGDAVSVSATDDGQGNLVPSGTINLMESANYTLTIQVQNSGGDNLHDTISARGEDFLFLFGFVDTTMASPSGSGNINDRSQTINYDDQDSNNRPIGLETSWETTCRDGGDAAGTFRVVLQNQGSEKSDTSTIGTGTTQFDITWDLNVQEDQDAPPCENEEEVINLVVLNFVAKGTTDTLTFEWFDEDGDAPGMPVIDPVLLDESTEYDLFVEFFNTIEGEDITDEIREEDDEHQLFFGFSDTLFASPSGNGNDMEPFGPINYEDADDNGRPLGLETSWTAICRGGEGDASGEFRVTLKHQPGEKDDDSDVNTGETDIAVVFPTTIVADPQAPPCENEEEVINLVVLNFVAKGTTDTLTFEWFDADGDAPLPPTIDEIELDESTEYNLFVAFFNTIEGEDITDEIREEDDEHQLFFGFTDTLFASPSGNGNDMEPFGPINYQDFDGNGRPLGLSTAWAATCRGGAGDASGEFRVTLKHQPGEKDDDSDVNTGETDIAVVFPTTIVADPQAPPCENEEEEINLVVLNFVEKGTTDTLKFEWFNEDGEGPLPPTIERIQLNTSTEYELFIELRNTIEGEDITDEIREEDDEHQFFFGWTGGLFTDPTGNGNDEPPFGPVNYLDFDDNQRPVGLETEWTTTDEAFSGSFRVVLKHQPGEKDDDSDVTVGGTDIDISFPYNNVVTSTEEAPLAGALRLFPNPVRDQLQVEMPTQSVGVVDLFIFDLSGRMVAHERQPGVGGIMQINTSNLAKGTYLMQARTADTSWTQRFVKID